VARILVVDDDRGIRSFVAMALVREGFDATGVATGEEALALVADGSFDAVLTDLRLEGMDGIELLRRLKTQAPALPVLLMTGYGTIENAVEAMSFGASNYLRKPFGPTDLVASIRKAVARREPASERGADGPAPPDTHGIVGRSRGIQELLDLVRKVGDTDSTVLITGETGTGKELVGRAIHRVSRRSQRTFSAVNSAAFPETLLESELFGHRRGAFTGAATNKKGLFECADQGTVFLDEVAEMPLSMQAKLLRFLQTGEIRPVGGETTRRVDVRLVAATNKDLEREVEAGRFREDLYYRLAVIPIHVPPLRQRREDIPLLVSHFLRRYSVRLGKAVQEVEPAALEVLLEYPWPGNVRELENTLERGVALSRGSKIALEDLPGRLLARELPGREEELQSLHALERMHILRTLERVSWNRKRAAEILQISTTTLWRRLKEFGIEEMRVVAPPSGGRFCPPEL
jgi:two-component system NtrC family response regulator